MKLRPFQFLTLENQGQKRIVRRYCSPLADSGIDCLLVKMAEGKEKGGGIPDVR
jgi:hypothetical protein